jgi:hypothetical protein
LVKALWLLVIITVRRTKNEFYKKCVNPPVGYKFGLGAVLAWAMKIEDRGLRIADGDGKMGLARALALPVERTLGSVAFYRLLQAITAYYRQIFSVQIRPGPSEQLFGYSHLLTAINAYSRKRGVKNFAAAKFLNGEVDDLGNVAISCDYLGSLAAPNLAHIHEQEIKPDMRMTRPDQLFRACNCPIL